MPKKTAKLKIWIMMPSGEASFAWKMLELLIVLAFSNQSNLPNLKIRKITQSKNDLANRAPMKFQSQKNKKVSESTKNIISTS